MKQESFSDIEYSCRKKKTRREEFLEIMDDIIPWDEWVSQHVDDLPLGGEALAAAGRAQEQAVRLFVKRNFLRDGKNQAGKAPWTVKSRFRG